MTEATDTPQGGTEGADTSSQVETNPEATTGQPEAGADDLATADDAGEVAEKPKQVPWFQKRIDEVTAKKYEAEREAAYWRGKAEAGTPKEVAQQPEAKALPTLEQFNYDETAYQQALTDHIRQETEKSLDQTLSKREKAAAEQQKTQTALTKLSTDGAKHPDFAAAVNDLPANEAIRDFVLEEPNAADVLYELGKDAAATARFNSLPLHLQALELGRRAATIAAPKARTIAPPPPQTVGGLSAGMTKPAEQMTMAEYAAARKAGSL